MDSQAFVPRMTRPTPAAKALVMFRRVRIPPPSSHGMCTAAQIRSIWLEIFWLSVEGCVQVDQMQPIGPGVLPFFGKGDGIT